jgi:hypothetical protein
LGDVFKCDWSVLFHEHDWAVPFCGSVSQTVDELVNLVRSSSSDFVKKGAPKDMWRVSVANLLASKTVGKYRYG